MTSALERGGGTPKEDEVTEIAWIILCRSVPGGSKQQKLQWTWQVDGMVVDSSVLLSYIRFPLHMDWMAHLKDRLRTERSFKAFQPIYSMQRLLSIRPGHSGGRRPRWGTETRSRRSRGRGRRRRAWRGRRAPGGQFNRIFLAWNSGMALNSEEKVNKCNKFMASFIPLLTPLKLSGQ